MTNRFHLAAIVATAVSLLPTLTFAATSTAGTSDYLRSIGYTDVQLSGNATTEQREAFSAVQGAGSVSDPLGDEVDRKGGATTVNAAYGDISNATLTKNDAAQTWDVLVTLGGPIPEKPTDKIELFILMDTNGDLSDNAADGIRVGVDMEFSVQCTKDHPWYTDYRWFNKGPQFWAVNKETKSTFEIGTDTIAYHIPFAEVSGDATPTWRVVMAAASGNDSEIDVAPGIGFPPPKGETYPIPPTSKGFDLPPAVKWIGLTAAVAAVSVLVHRKFAKKRKK
ncbi:MAG: hypothetical protein WCO25_03330 [Candidatus Uhrbacteria bacterium]